MTRYQFHKSSYSTANGECVEVAINVPGTIRVRDSKDPDGPALAFTPSEWTHFQQALTTGTFAT
ncbi:DUF397 domain-containing protein [Streptomyces sp. NPDC088910]|uniref:DUF397 domain-containing protein n=1 Tax=Streptomyces sp. NPDC088910 TaxID=3365911 RepID=UPI0038074838